LSQCDVTKIVVVNKEFAEIYTNPDKLYNSKHKKVTQGIFSFKMDTHYSMNMASLIREDTEVGFCR
tara:strand:+ start:901 stop:1098 length:198 start_codon:yes stop_codon:yes gene_type:complete